VQCLPHLCYPIYCFAAYSRRVEDIPESAQGGEYFALLRKPKVTASFLRYPANTHFDVKIELRAIHVVGILILVVVEGSVLVPGISATPSLLPLSTNGTSIVDSAGRIVMLRGVNYPGYGRDHPELHNSAAYKTLSTGFGFNVVRLPISWANLEPQQGVFNSTYLSSFVDRDVQWASSAGVYVVLDMHQDNWAQRFGGSGAPDWAVQQYPPNETGMRMAVSEFWANTELQDHLVQVWVNIAQHFAHNPTIAGYDLLNEPWIYTSVIAQLNGTAVDAFYSRTVQAIRAVDSNHIIFLEPANMNTLNLPTSANIVWPPHFYQLSFSHEYDAQNFTELERAFIAQRNKYVNGFGVPMWIGEFGSFMPDNLSRAIWTQDALTLFNRYQVGWAWWAYNGNYTSIPDQLYVR
jgi:endoglycosylceramidase